MTNVSPSFLFFFFPAYCVIYVGLAWFCFYFLIDLRGISKMSYQLNMYLKYPPKGREE